MSEPVTNAEVEDVLSSIRRLVSEDKRPLQTSNPTPVPSPVEAPGPVTDAEAQAAAPQQQDEGAEFKSMRSTAADKITSEDFTPHLSLRATTASPARPDSDDETSELLKTTPQPLSLTQAMQTEEDDSAEEAEPPFVSARHPATPPADKTLSASSDRLVLTPALRVATSDGKDRPQPAAVDPAKVSPLDYDMLHDDPSDLHAEDYGTPASEPVSDAAAEVEAKARTVSEAVAKATGASRSDKLAALETAIGKISDDWDPDAPGDNDYSGTEPPAMEWKDDAELEAPIADTAGVEAEKPTPRRPQPSTPQVEEQVRRFADSGPRVADPAATAPEFGYTVPTQDEGVAGDDQFLDEEALRDLVTEIVRAELQGALGERITRNVRKLVRREIHRALTAQDLE